MFYRLKIAEGFALVNLARVRTVTCIGQKIFLNYPTKGGALLGNGFTSFYDVLAYKTVEEAKTVFQELEDAVLAKQESRKQTTLA